jgi:hypothetical protein
MAIKTETAPKAITRPGRVDTQCVYVDIEVDSHDEVYQVGIVTKDYQRVYSREQFDEAGETLSNLKMDHPFLCGHNIRRFDKPYIDRLWPELKWKRMIDTLELSHLVDPLKPSHRLTKHYKTSSLTANDPVADALATEELLFKILEDFAQMEHGLRTWILWLITHGESNADQAYRKFFRAVGYDLPSSPYGPALTLLSDEQRCGLDINRLKALRNSKPGDFNQRLCAAYLLSWNAARQANDVCFIAPWIEHLKPFEQEAYKLCKINSQPPPAASFLPEFGLSAFRPLQKARKAAVP